MELTQSELAKEFGISMRSIQRWEADEWPVPKWAERVMELLKKERW